MMELQLGPYRVLDEIGRGGMGVVYLARQESLDRIVALKVLHFADALLADRLRREVKALAALQSPYIVPVFDVGDADGRPYYAMSFCAGGSLADVLKTQGALAPAQVVMVMSSVASALASMHEAGMIHRDIKASNVLVTAEGRPLVADLGLVTGGEQSRVTTSGAVMGTLGSMAPELLDDAEPSPATDAFALGVLGYEVASGRQPFAGRNVSAVLDAVRRGQFPPLIEVAPALPPPLAALIEEAMRHEPGQRPADLEAWADRLTDVVKPVRLRPVQRAESTGSTVYTDRRSDEQRKAQATVGTTQNEGGRQWRVRIMVGATVAALVAAGVWIVARPGGDDPPPVATMPALDSVELPSIEEADGVTSSSKWELLADGRVRGITVVTNRSDQAVVRHDELIPKAIATDAADVVATPTPDSIPQQDPVLRFCLRIESGDTATVVWTTGAVDPALTSDDLEALVDAWYTAAVKWQSEHADAVCSDDSTTSSGPSTSGGVTSSNTATTTTTKPTTTTSKPTTTTSKPTATTSKPTTTPPNHAPVATVSPSTENICAIARNFFDFGPGNGHASALASDQDGDHLTYEIVGSSRIYDLVGPDASDVVSFFYDSGSVAQTSVYVSWRARDSHGAASNTVTQTFNVFGC